MPNNVIIKTICKNSCCLKTDCPESYKEYFNANILDSNPIESCPDENPLKRFNY